MKALLLLSVLILTSLNAFAAVTCKVDLLKDGFTKIESAEAQTLTNGSIDFVLSKRNIAIEIFGANGLATATVAQGEIVLATIHGIASDLAAEINLANNESVSLSCLADPPAPKK